MANDMVNLASAVNSSVVSGDMSGRKAAQAHSTEALVSKADVEKAQTSLSGMKWKNRPKTCKRLVMRRDGR